MRVIASIDHMRRWVRRWKRQGAQVALAPTMGYLHEGHLSLAREARRRVGPRGKVVVSIYVNPTQFAPHEDLARYPRDLARDRRLCRAAGVDALFVPTDSVMYPGEGFAAFSTYVVEEALSRGLEGVSRPAHFRGVATVVAKLFNIVQPDVGVFGAKDCQQAAIVRRMARDLNFPVRLVVAPTVREFDGLALSSRNQYLSASERAQAPVLWEAIQLARREVARATRPLPAAQLCRKLERLIATAPAARVDYLEFFDPETFRPVRRVGPGCQVALAVFVGATRLIDNAMLG